MRYKINLKGKIYEVEVEKGEAMLIDEYEAKAPAAPAAAAPAAVPAAAAAPAPAAAAPAPAAIASGETVNAPLPGTVLDVKVATGDAVKKGQVLMIIEAMKMENEVLANSDGVIKQVVVSKGQSVKTGDALVVM
ncbi:MAG: biotin/lipoyl-binding protein [Firmicutes bacterium]|nr:biotin/lipoyl-binding protein [Bacillota bacterium]